MAATIGLAHEIAGYLLIVSAILIVAVSGPRYRSRVFAVFFAALIVVVVVAGCGESAAAAVPTAASATDAPGWLGAALLGAGVVGLGFGVVLIKAALTLLGEAVGALLFGLRVALTAFAVLGAVVAVLILSV